jgi:TATA-box binding protein (TBP) (component of TFIID and TFIIIB)
MQERSSTVDIDESTKDAPSPVGGTRKRSFVDAFERDMMPGGVVDASLKKIGSEYEWPENVVVPARLSDELDIRRFSATRYNAYIPHEFETFTVRIEDREKTTALLFRTARSVIAGARSIEQIYQGLHRVRLELAACGKTTTVEELRLVNMVWNTVLELEHGISLADVFANHMDCSDYTPTMFPGLKYENKEFGVKWRIFDTKRLVIMGSKCAGDIQLIKQKAMEMVSKHPDDNLPESGQRFEYRKRQKIAACNRVAAASGRFRPCDSSTRPTKQRKRMK